MIDFIESGGTLEGEDQVRLISIVDSSLRVSNEHQFYSWTQCEIQYLIPHEILVCGIWVGAEPGPKLYSFSSIQSFQETMFPAICNSSDGLLKQIMTKISETGKGFILSHTVTIGNCDETWLALLESHQLENIAAHGLRGPDGRLKSIFCFSKVTGTLCNRLLYLLEVLLPILESTLSRVVASQHIEAKYGSNNPPEEPKKLELGAREIQIIKLIKVGKTNQVIADELFISPLTVKNHVQNILKKLKVKTRGHAVARAIDLGLLKTK
jgi:transcriptional regulator EpsA